jgi:Ni,Fe-hydrogenase III large subunit
MSASIFSDWPIVEHHRGWTRRLAPADGWRTIGENLRSDDLMLLGLWGDGDCAHAALHERSTRTVTIATAAVADGRLPSLGMFHPPAIRLERALQDLHGIDVTALPDPRSWLDHGRWQTAAPLGAGRTRATSPCVDFLPAEGPSLHQIPVGPVHAGIIEPGHFRFTAHGETVVRLEQRLGYVHKGIERLMQGRSIQEAGRLASRVSGDSTVAYAWAFTRAVEMALGVEPPPRAVWLRAIMAEIERLANHLGDIGAVCNDASFSLLYTECGVLRELALRAAATGFGHRLMMDRIVPGGASEDLETAGVEAIRHFITYLERRLPELAELYDNTASLQDRTVGTGKLKPHLASLFGCGGFIGRASGRDFDARRDLPYPPYDTLPPEVTVLEDGDVDARVRVRIAEVQASARLLDRLLASLPAGALHIGPLVPADGPVEASAIVEGFRGDIFAFVRVGTDLRIERCHLRDPSWFQWPLLEAAIEGNIVADFPLCNKSFNCSYSGHDL